MKTAQALLGVTNNSRNWLRMWSSDFSEAEATSSGGTATNPLAWQLAHIAAIQDEVYMIFAGKPGVVPASLRTLAGNASASPVPGTPFPPVNELWTLLDQTHANITALIEATPEGEFDSPPKSPHPFFKSLGQALYTIASNEAYHTGQIGALRKALGKKKIV